MSLINNEKFNHRNTPTSNMSYYCIYLYGVISKLALAGYHKMLNLNA